MKKSTMKIFMNGLTKQLDKGQIGISVGIGILVGLMERNVNAFISNTLLNLAINHIANGITEVQREALLREFDDLFTQAEMDSIKDMM